MNVSSVTPVEFCQKQRTRFVELSTAEGRKKKGQFFTPPDVAHFMASLYPIRKKTLRLLDPGAGVGMLTCAICEKASRGKSLKAIHIDAYENDMALAGLLNESLKYAREWMREMGTELTYDVIQDDFIIANADNLWKNEREPYDLAIANPPYFKIGKNDPRAASSAEFVYGQPNIYALFMGVTANLLKKKGNLIFITPRSYTSGVYFKAFRNYFFSRMSPVRVHIFESRKDAFRKDDVLQENIILRASKEGDNKTVGITTSQGSQDLRKGRVYHVPISLALHRIGNNIIFRLPKDEQERKTLETVDAWKGSLNKYEMEISTGPVVTFRATELIPENDTNDGTLVPLLWMHNVRPMSVEWPSDGVNNNRKEKRRHIKNNKESRRRRLLVRNQNLVLLRRFSAKEDIRRLVAAPLPENQLKFELVGLENHLNYIYKPKGAMNEPDIMGIAALLNSSLLDQYFRISNGNTQVSAAELRVMPLPPLALIKKIGEKVRDLSISDLERLNGLVEDILNLNLSK